MSKYLGLILHAPLQSWSGISLPDPNSKSPRNTELFPTKSALIGLLRSALGVGRGLPDEYSLDKLRIIVRVDRSGSIVKDYQIAQRTHHGFRAGSTKEIPKMALQEASFVVLLGHEDENVLYKLNEALENPEWAPFYGRRAHVPTLPPTLGIVETDDVKVLLQETIPVLWNKTEKSVKTVTVYDSHTDDFSGSAMLYQIMDEPLSYDPRDRNYGTREVQFYNTSFSKPEKIDTIIEQYKKMKEIFA